MRDRITRGPYPRVRPLRLLLLSLVFLGAVGAAAGLTARTNRHSPDEPPTSDSNPSPAESVNTASPPGAAIDEVLGSADGLALLFDIDPAAPPPDIPPVDEAPATEVPPSAVSELLPGKETVSPAGGVAVAPPSIQAPASVAPASVAAPAAPVSMGSLAEQVLSAHNATRAQHGLPALTADATLNAIAQRRASDMAAARYLSHASPSGETAFTLLSAYGVGYQGAGENIARNSMSGSAAVSLAMNGWIGSSAHLANILNRSFRRIGVGVVQAADGSTYFAVVFTT